MTANISSIDLFNILRQKVGEAEAKALADFVVTEVENRLEEKSKILATKEDIAALKIDMREQKVDTIKWLVGLFITLALMIIGLYLKK